MQIPGGTFCFLLADVISYHKYDVFKQPQDIVIDSTEAVVYNQSRSYNFLERSNYEY